MRHLVLAVLVALLLSACGGQGGRGASDGSPASRQDLGQKPVVEIPQGEPPTTLQVETLVEGSGPAAARGDTLTVHYVGVAWSTGEQFDASWDREEPFRFALGGRVIDGWNEGLEGMREGERRRLVIPPEKGYGERGAPPLIGPGETLVFVVDLLEVTG